MTQIADQIKTGVLRPGQTLPSIRELTLQCSVSRNTVIHAYDRLAEMRLIAPRDRSGFYVLCSTARTESATAIDELMPSTPGRDRLAFSVMPENAARRLLSLAERYDLLVY
jgi:DNA-binding GntR family transcriptional regulator